MVGQDIILSTDFMVTACIRLELADGTLCLHDEVHVRLSGPRTIHDNRVLVVKLGKYAQIPIDGYVEVPI